MAPANGHETQLEPRKHRRRSELEYSHRTGFRPWTSRHAQQSPFRIVVLTLRGSGPGRSPIARVDQNVCAGNRCELCLKQAAIFSHALVALEVHIVLAWVSRAQLLF